MAMLDALIAEDATAEILAGSDGKRGVAGTYKGRVEIADVIAKRRNAFTKLVIIPDVQRVEPELVEVTFLAQAHIEHPRSPGVSSDATYDVVARYELRGTRIAQMQEHWTMRPKKRRRAKKSR